MSKHLFVSCLAATFLFAGAAITPGWADTVDTLRSGQFIFNDPVNPGEEQPREETEGEDRQGGTWNLRPTHRMVGGTILQQEEQGEEGAVPQPESPPKPEDD
jgi:hypothetical protein